MREQREGHPPGGAERLACLAGRERLGQSGEPGDRVGVRAGQQHHRVREPQQVTGLRQRRQRPLVQPELGEPVRLRYVGPLPPFNFVDLATDEEAAAWA